MNRTDTAELRISAFQLLNRDRANRWHNGNFRNWGTLEWAGAMCGEAGELANIAKKMKRIDSSVQGNEYSDSALLDSARLTETQAVDYRALQIKLGNEAADVFIYLLLCCESANVDLESFVVSRFNKKSEEMKFPEVIII